MKKIVITLFALASAVRLFAQSADPSPTDAGKTDAQPNQRHERHGFWERLQLTDDQRDKLKQIREADRDSLRSARAQVKIARESLKAALLANPENSSDIQTKATTVGNALSTSAVQMALHLAKINEVLTPAQRVELAEARRHRMMRRWRWRDDTDRDSGEERRPWQRQNQPPEQTPSPAQG
jgi:Spy/CpxP family protein refolding chaperone